MYWRVGTQKCQTCAETSSRAASSPVAYSHPLVPPEVDYYYLLLWLSRGARFSQRVGFQNLQNKHDLLVRTSFIGQQWMPIWRWGGFVLPVFENNHFDIYPSGTGLVTGLLGRCWAAGRSWKNWVILEAGDQLFFKHFLLGWLDSMILLHLFSPNFGEVSQGLGLFFNWNTWCYFFTEWEVFNTCCPARSVSSCPLINYFFFQFLLPPWLGAFR